ncbi:hypothetical protein TCON_1539 [Astathelohania contejeani]|uniref:Uncharacterized protein n=1 Tax=Astathelohania contejeani TaxID=164912 RepID=A0ABQ7HYJ3_9MICR|nr:hypothetical protein TCON_1539 [Thelohania contejeani]
MMCDDEPEDIVCHYFDSEEKDSDLLNCNQYSNDSELNDQNRTLNLSLNNDIKFQQNPNNTKDLCLSGDCVIHFFPKMKKNKGYNRRRSDNQYSNDSKLNDQNRTLNLSINNDTKFQQNPNNTKDLCLSGDCVIHYFPKMKKNKGYNRRRSDHASVYNYASNPIATKCTEEKEEDKK